MSLLNNTSFSIELLLEEDMLASSHPVLAYYKFLLNTLYLVKILL